MNSNVFCFFFYFCLTLSLAVGEPIMYPEINQLLGLLDAQGISTFVVTNAQFPNMIRDLNPCTQLYVSIDAATRDALKAVDRPLFPDFWERFLASIDSLRQKDLYQRTVFRMTLVKQWNMDMEAECERYANLIQRGQPGKTLVVDCVDRGKKNKHTNTNSCFFSSSSFYSWGCRFH